MCLASCILALACSTQAGTEVADDSESVATEASSIAWLPTGVHELVGVWDQMRADTPFVAPDIGVAHLGSIQVDGAGGPRVVQVLITQAHPDEYGSFKDWGNGLQGWNLRNNERVRLAVGASTGNHGRSAAVLARDGGSPPLLMILPKNAEAPKRNAIKAIADAAPERVQLLTFPGEFVQAEDAMRTIVAVLNGTPRDRLDDAGKRLFADPEHRTFMEKTLADLRAHYNIPEGSVGQFAGMMRPHGEEWMGWGAMAYQMDLIHDVTEFAAAHGFEDFGTQPNTVAHFVPLGGGTLDYGVGWVNLLNVALKDNVQFEGKPWTNHSQQTVGVYSAHDTRAASAVLGSYIEPLRRTTHRLPHGADAILVPADPTPARLVREHVAGLIPVTDIDARTLQAALIQRSSLSEGVGGLTLRAAFDPSKWPPAVRDNPNLKYIVVQVTGHGTSDQVRDVVVKTYGRRAREFLAAHPEITIADKIDFTIARHIAAPRLAGN